MPKNDAFFGISPSCNFSPANLRSKRAASYPHAMDLQLLANRFYDHSSFIRGYSQATIDRYRFAIEYYAKQAGVSRIEEVAADNVRQALFNGRMVRNWKPGSFICIYRSLAVFFRWCVGEGCLKGNPLDGIELPKLEKRLPSRIKK